MSAVKRVFTHSAIRSAIRKPFIANDDGYREYLKRSVFELNGTQWGELSEPVVLDGDFEIEWVGIINNDLIDSGAYLLADSDASPSFRLIINKGQMYVGSATEQRRFDTSSVSFTQVSKISVVRAGGVLEAFVNNVALDDVSPSPQVITYVADLIGKQWGGNTTVPNLDGATFNLKIWTNGDHNTGDLILNVPFDESGSDYQRNLAVTLGVSLLPATSITDGAGWVSTSVEFDNALIFENEDNFAGANYDIGYSYSTTYEIEFEIFDYVSGNLQATLEGVGSENKAGNGIYKVYLRSPDAGLTRFFLRARNGVGEGIFKVRNISIREWSGVILQNALPEHWMQIERKRWWDYWLGVQNLFGPTSNGSVSWTYDGNGTYTKDSDTWGQLGENFGNVSVPGTYQVGFNYSGSGLRLYTQNPAGGNQFLAVPNAGRVLWDYAVPKAGLWFDSNVAIGAEISNISFRRKLEIAQ